jgi:tetratricopeptide (TPR) repeat protein
MALGVAFGLASASLLARADTPPSVWDRARDPSASDTYRIHLEVQRRLAQDDDIGDGRELGVLALRSMLEHVSAETSPDVRLRFDLGRITSMLGPLDENNYVQSARILKAALRDAPDHPMAERAWLTLAFACGHLGDHECERTAYLEVLKLSTEDVLRATPMLNLAEAEMHLGNMAEAVDTYREALRISEHTPVSSEIAPLAVWGLAVALDRSGDLAAAENHARFAVELERSMGLRPEASAFVSALLHAADVVFFFPAYEIYWYDGLGASAVAKATTNPVEVARLWRIAERSFATYVQRSEGRDRWAEIARVRLSTAKAERAKAERRMGKEPFPRPTGP